MDQDDNFTIRAHTVDIVDSRQVIETLADGCEMIFRPTCFCNTKQEDSK